MQTTNAYSVLPVFVFLNLLKGNTQFRPKRCLASAFRHPGSANLAAYVQVNSVSLAAAHFSPPPKLQSIKTAIKKCRKLTSGDEGDISPKL